MKIDDLRKSDNIRDQRGQRSSGGGLNMGGAGSNLLLHLLFSRTGWKTKIVLLVLLLFLGGGSGLGNILGGTSSNYQSSQVRHSGTSTVTDKDGEFISKVLASTEDYWHQEFKRNGLTYEAPKLVLYTDNTTTGCGAGSAKSGPFYCSADNTVYLDLSFYGDLKTKYGAPGDFAMAYVIAHEVGHHVQNQLGTMSEYASARRGLSEKEANKLNVRLELQADYYAGAWANYVDGQGLLDIGDIEEAMTAAHSVGDDHLQEQAYGRAMPDSFTHGTSEQRKRWFDRGYNYGDLQHGDTFSVNENSL
ncbi:KPN_02809 family neutral zinc metallopeptidase [Streptococcus sp. S784/96/1]|uniref:KPN_02809 family neutral zinc metallopeptidase n=1 Tax=Streptococcus sp. S784/96/1 TaxID=2653499 RepID=UPI001386EB4C|nr:neutral zinc metallopeptidase [Streptococcus sp. S784/96/1]